ncbi:MULTISPECIES: helix-turn-helix transcriptional regulator [unclassified Pseudomonas]|uniref:helix-turn-helix transcriptional regulator n=1 Tax=unclassified Pseudomonas TaxID=196821 RepID=UPI000C87C390|nr:MULTISPECIES: AraC family transcriptional regulator [unclassified Pseudomonas]PMU10721.1 DNA-binding response regulator [Pseudomonas sp. FW305-20]PMU20664.1 DNA-binding response regulator [Pseudomonas sp. FW305-122]PMU36251.1 DNA-binding response regulator [Pseudomonas sp. FW305-47B]PMX63308.1 DNA-binding response regulator [Pseudomonas sp. FW305-33]PMX69225.1 DNA-binding response regulator [Pseudomonas sp. FW305-60]
MTSNLTRRPTLLWFDLTHDRSTKELIAQFEGTCDGKLAKNSVLPIGVNADMICIHFDRPDTPGLRLLLDIKRSAPAIPITMFTVQHSEELAVWAMRSSVWEYIVLPLSVSERNRYLTAVVQLCELRRNVIDHRKTQLIDHSPTLPDSIRLTSGHQKHQALSSIMLYIEQHFRDSIDQRDLAQRCGMTTFRFSRLFKEANGLGFTDYILNKRMNFAKELLDNSQMPITSIGYEAGFKDPSYFARAFKQFANCTPSEYRLARQLRATASAQMVQDEKTTEALESLVQSLSG